MAYFLGAASILLKARAILRVISAAILLTYPEVILAGVYTTSTRVYLFGINRKNGVMQG